VAGFFGTPTINFLEGVVDNGPAGPRFRGAGLEQVLPASLPTGLSGRSVVLGVRSEHVVIDGAASTPGTTRLLEPLGDVTLVHFDAGEGKSLVAKVAPSTKLRPGSPLKFSFAPEHCHLFDATSGLQRI
jgi:multiple sugar transport system ATP-binding protein